MKPIPSILMPPFRFDRRKGIIELKQGIMENLFVYGTLQEEKVQQIIFGRKLHGQQDLLKGYEKYSIRIPDDPSGTFYPAIRPSKNHESMVRGTLLLLKENDLMMADSYEGNSYLRKKLKLKSGITAWTYVAKKVNQ